jgi:signal transduction histidine kinase
MEVEDHGKGIPPEKRDEIASSDTVGLPGVGIRGMRERLQQLGGKLEIASKDMGTLVIARLPVSGNSSSVAA